MAAHVSTKQVIDYIKTIKKISVDGIIYDQYTVDETSLVIDVHRFPFAYFDVGGMDPDSLILIGTDHEFHRVQFHDENNKTLLHPTWDIEDYDPTRVKNNDIMAIAHKTPFNK